MNRESFATRLGFVLMSAGCAIGLGNVWRFPYIAGQYGGGLFFLVYLLFLILLGFPVLLMELAVGRAGQLTLPGALEKLQNPEVRFQWRIPGYVLLSGNVILLMFYTVVTGWILSYTVDYLWGRMSVGAVPAHWEDHFGQLLASPARQTGFMMIGLIFTGAVCIGGIRQRVEPIVKFMMIGLILLIGLLCAETLSLPNAGKGVRFLLFPDPSRFSHNLPGTIHAAMMHAFFTLSIGIGAMTIFGSYLKRDRSLARETVWIIALDTLVATLSAVMILSVCASFKIDTNSGPSLVFITLPNIFAQMTCGSLWGTVFFLFLSIAALSTLIGIFENLVAFGMDEFGWTRPRSTILWFFITAVLSLPCILGYNALSFIRPFGGTSNIMDLEDFLVSDNLLPLGALYITRFCLSRRGWGEQAFSEEVCFGTRLTAIPKWGIFYLNVLLPIIVLTVWVTGVLKRFGLLSF